MKKKIMQLVGLVVVCFGAVSLWAQEKNEYNPLADYAIAISEDPNFFADPGHRLEAWMNLLNYMNSTRDDSNLGKILQYFEVDQTLPVYRLEREKGYGFIDYAFNTKEVDTLLYSSLVQEPALAHQMLGGPLSRIVKRLLFEFQANPNLGAYITTQDGMELMDTPLGYAAARGMSSSAEQLLRAGADPNFTWDMRYDITWGKDKLEPVSVSYDKEGWSALKKAVLSPKNGYNAEDRAEMIDLLTRYGADVNEVDNCGVTVLTKLMMCATKQVGARMCPQKFSEEDYQVVVQALLNQGANPRIAGEPNHLCSGVGGISAMQVLKEMSSKEKRQSWEQLLKNR